MTEPFYAPNRKPPAKPQHEPGELLFTFRDPQHHQIDCELRDNGQYGIEAQFWRDRRFWYSRRLDTRDLAIQWATLERQALLDGVPSVAP